LRLAAETASLPRLDVYPSAFSAFARNQIPASVRAHPRSKALFPKPFPNTDAMGIMHWIVSSLPAANRRSVA
jgi:hypothetical protein